MIIDARPPKDALNEQVWKWMQKHPMCLVSIGFTGAYHLSIYTIRHMYVCVCMMYIDSIDIGYQKSLIDMCNCKPDFASDDSKRHEPLQILCLRPSWALRHICRSPVHHFTWDFNAHFCSWKLQYLSILDVPKATIYQIYILGVIRFYVLWWKWNSDTGLGLEHQIYQVANQVQLRGHLVVICHENSKV